MIPVGVLSFNRYGFLDVTLKSLSATSAPSVTIFDDHSRDINTVRYLYGNLNVSGFRWTRDARWVTLGLDIIKNSDYIKPIGGKVEVVDVGGRGVVHASLFAINHMMSTNPKAKGVILLQDDVVLNPDWYERLIATIGYDMDSGKRQGMIAGMQIEELWTVPIPPVENRRFASAQCYYVSREFWNTFEWKKIPSTVKRYFDTHLCKRVLSAGMEVHLIHPFVCQHIGVESTIVPGFDFLDNRRYGCDVRPKFAMASEVRNYNEVRRLHSMDVSTNR